MSDVNEVNALSAKQLLDSGALLLDVRTPQEFAKGHVEGAAPKLHLHNNFTFYKLPASLCKAR